MTHRPLRLIGWLALVLLVATVGAAEEAKRVPRDYLATIVDDDPDPLPRYMTEAERSLPLPTPEYWPEMAPPSGGVYTPAEYAASEGLLIKWGSYLSVLTEMTVGITTGDPDGVVYILVTGPSQQASATSVLQGAGADMAQVEFITYTANTVWIRDYGPRFIREDAHRAMVDHTYNRPRPLDNAFTNYLSTLWGEPQYDIPLVHGGGNFHFFATGHAYMSDLILDENPGLSEQEVVDYYATYQNLDLTIVPGFPTWFDHTQHIDMWMQPVDDDELIIGEYDPSDGEPHTITEAVTAELEAQGYTVHRTPGWQSLGGTHYTYTNAVIFNDIVFVPEFAGYPTENAQAVAAFQAAFESHQVIPVDCSQIIGAAGAIHCVVMQVPEILEIFTDGFETGDFSAWSASFP